MHQRLTLSQSLFERSDLDGRFSGTALNNKYRIRVFFIIHLLERKTTQGRIENGSTWNQRPKMVRLSPWGWFLNILYGRDIACRGVPLLGLNLITETT